MSLSTKLMNSILEGVDVRKVIANPTSFITESEDKAIYESIAGMSKEEKEQLDSLFDTWKLKSGINGWEFLPVRYSDDVYAIKLVRNPIADFRVSPYLEKDGDILNVEVYFEPHDVYLSASGPCTLNGLKSALRDLSTQEQSEIDDYEEEVNDPNYGIH